MEKNRIEEYMNSVRDLLDLHLQKEDFLKKIIEGYGNYRVAIYLDKIGELNRIIEKGRIQLDELEQEIKRQK
ncbi:hypothetical protein FHG64_13095 [Antarcticibacterium flavum]|uniref:Uncharacterized protein n=1 Tax=Antarcticibacterium flavum TaxID=2058175 RepID=A0A5B7X6K9_9FLAO|nr:MULTISPECIES: hypothetical protein [Antarcticibacterium]MCM4158515.1 hypothetical protein [Antarcticibacterium sp. W02-3]QCY70263.1 hypothetical protein FHG64_13095 [Antarcticibacterium flavum]